MSQSFRLAPMSGGMRVLTALLLALPLAFVLAALLTQQTAIVAPAILMLAIYAWVWLRFRPTRFEVHLDALEVVWPLKRRRIPRREIGPPQLIDGPALRGMTGFAARVGAGGLWGGFGWLWTRRRGVVQMYISRTDRFVWFDREGGRSWLITPERAEEFVALLSDRPGRLRP